MNDRAIRLVLDASAIAAYGSSLDVGETIAEVDDNGDSFGLPVNCLAAATPTTQDHVLKLLLDHPAAQVVGLEAISWRPLGAMYGVLGQLECASALYAGSVHDCEILTVDPTAYRDLGDEPPIITGNPSDSTVGVDSVVSLCADSAALTAVRPHTQLPLSTAPVRIPSGCLLTDLGT